ncbi:MAG TPA: GDP-L-fucose synthase [Candidatus Acidoferrum sp.]|nr:GDP-L-fucose synthase [Candidatus Acidoferrum sp.]
MEKDARIYVAGSDTSIGAALVRALGRHGYEGLVGVGDDPDFTDAGAVAHAFAALAPHYVFVAAGRSGGIGLNQREPARLMRDNLLVASHVLEASRRHRVRKLLYLASSCIYPRACAQPMREEALMTGPLEPTSAPYALAKLAGLTLCHAYRGEHGSPFVAAIAGDSFGPGDEFDAEDAHVVAALMGKMHRARRAGAPAVEVWGTGSARRDFIFVDDLAEAGLCVMERYDDPGPINLGGGGELSIAELAALIREVVGYRGEIRFDRARPDGTPRKVLDGGRLAALGWQRQMSMREALRRTYEWFRDAGLGERS